MCYALISKLFLIVGVLNRLDFVVIYSLLTGMMIVD